MIEDRTPKLLRDLWKEYQETYIGSGYNRCDADKIIHRNHSHGFETNEYEQVVLVYRGEYVMTLPDGDIYKRIEEERLT